MRQVMTMNQETLCLLGSKRSRSSCHMPPLVPKRILIDRSIRAVMTFAVDEVQATRLMLFDTDPIAMARLLVGKQLWFLICFRLAFPCESSRINVGRLYLLVVALPHFNPFVAN